MRHGPAWRCLGLATLLLLAQAWSLSSTRPAWLGHGPLTSQAVVVASEWPGIVLAAVGALIVLLPRLQGMEDYHLTSVHSERSLAWGSWGRAAVAAMAASLCAVVAAITATRSIEGFGRFKPALLALALVWPQAGLMVGVAVALVLPRRLRMAALVITPLAMFYALVGAAQLEPGPISELSPINATVLPRSVRDHVHQFTPPRALAAGPLRSGRTGLGTTTAVLDCPPALRHADRLRPQPPSDVDSQSRR